MLEAPKRRSRAKPQPPPVEAVGLLTYEMALVETLRPDRRNARIHSDDQIAEIARSIKRFGFTTPLIAMRDGAVVAGHGRLEAARRMGLHAVPVLRAPEGWSEADVRAYMLADNQLALNSEWNEQLLRDEIRALQMSGYDVSVIGFDEKELDRLLKVEAAPEQFPSFDENIETVHQCPRCNYRWSGGAIAPEDDESE